MQAESSEINLHFDPCDTTKVVFVMMELTSNKSLVSSDLKGLHSATFFFDTSIITSHSDKSFFAVVEVHLHDKTFITSNDALYFSYLLGSVK